jgi:D-alanine-D-alanine ligase
MTKHIALLYGGTSSEREVSLSSGEPCAIHLEKAGYKVTRIDVDITLPAVLEALKPDLVFNALHGKPGEDGIIQGLLEHMQIPYTHSGVLASALAMDKQQAKLVMAAAGIPVPKGVKISRQMAGENPPLPRPYVIKPNADGSSVGVHIILENQPHPREKLLVDDGKLDEMMLVEEFIDGHELTCAVMGDRVLGVIEIFAMTEFYDYEAKYTKGGSKHVCPAKISPNIYLKVQQYAMAAHQALGCRGVSRSDFRYDPKTERLVCLEVNTQPGMTATSLVPELAAHAGLTFTELVTWIAQDASLKR